FSVLKNQSPHSNNNSCPSGRFLVVLGGGLKGSSNSFFRSNFTRRFRRRKATMFDRCQLNLEHAFRYLSMSMVINAVQIWISTALVDVPRKVLILSSCLISLKNISISHRAL